jgi:hypothetical protein
MKEFKEFLANSEPELEENLEDVMWSLISSLDEKVLDNLSDEQITDYVDIVEMVTKDLSEKVYKVGKNKKERELLADVLVRGGMNVQAADLIKKGSFSYTMHDKSDIVFEIENYTSGSTLGDWENDFLYGVLADFEESVIHMSIEEPILEMKVKTNKGEVTLKGNDTIEYEAKPGVVRIGMAGDCLKKGVKFKKGGTWHVMESEIEAKFEDEEAIEEAMPAKRVRRDVIQKRKASREHRKVKAKKKLEGRRKRKTAAFKRYKKKSKRLGKRGLTSTGKRKRTFINKG